MLSAFVECVYFVCGLLFLTNVKSVCVLSTKRVSTKVEKMRHYIKLFLFYCFFWKYVIPA